MISVLICLAGIIIDGMAYEKVRKVGTCVNSQFRAYGLKTPDNILASALCQATSTRTVYGFSGTTQVPYECGCVESNSDLSFPTDTFSCNDNKAFYYNCAQLMLDEPTYQSCFMNIPANNILFGNNATSWTLSNKFCALYDKITSGVFNGCMCVHNNFMDAYLKGTIKPTNAKCMLYALNHDTLNCSQITVFLPLAFRASVAGGAVCLIGSMFYLLVIVRASCCPGCCVLSPKQILPISDAKLNSKYAEPELTEEAKLFEKAKLAAGLKEKQLAKELTDIEDIKRNKVERRDATPLYLAWYGHPEINNEKIRK